MTTSSAGVREWRLAHPDRARRLDLNNGARIASRRRVLASVKLTVGCVDCGYAERSEALHFDHLRDKWRPVSGNMSWANTWAEIDKCEVVCANCHAVRTADRRC